MTISLNGEPYDLAAPLTVSALLAHLSLDARRVAVELNLVVVKRAAFDSTMVQEGDEVEIVNFVGGGIANSKFKVQSSKCKVQVQSAKFRMQNTVKRSSRPRQ
jgi:thiamine biosynthesis protein ThiS